MARPKSEYDEEEVKEIILLKLDDLLGVKSKLTPNKVFTFNKKIDEKNSGYLRKNGEPFKLYGYHFWYTETEFGRKQIDEIKSEEEFILAGKSFTPNTMDIPVLVNKYHKKPEELTRKLINLFEKDRTKIKILEQERDEYIEKLNKANEMFEEQRQSFLSLFMESDNQTNSLKDVKSLKRSEDGLINDELKNVIGDNCDVDSVTVAINNDNIVRVDWESQKSTKERRSQLEDMGF